MLHVPLQVVAIEVRRRTYAAEKLSFVFAGKSQVSIHRLLGFVRFAAARARKRPVL